MFSTMLLFLADLMTRKSLDVQSLRSNDSLPLRAFLLESFSEPIAFQNFLVYDQKAKKN